jgi:hypothetical protein
MILIFLFLTLIIIISYPIIGYKIYKEIQKRNKRKLYRLILLLVILILLPGFFWEILPGSSYFWRPIEKIAEKNYNLELTGIEFNDGKLIYEYETERAFNGDGYSIWIYELEDKAINYFKKPNNDFFKIYPRTELRNHWQPEFWKKTPFNKNEQKFFDFAHVSLDNLNFELEDLLNEEGNYYAYEYYMHNFDIDIDSSVVGDIDFYIICPNRKIMVKINHNT